MDYLKKVQDCIGFQWDQFNIDKNWDKHKITPFECEQIFFNQPLIISNDVKHSQTEERFYALGRSDLNKELFIAFTIRKKLIRIISARRMSYKERRIYEEFKE